MDAQFLYVRNLKANVIFMGIVTPLLIVQIISARK
jgi:hypothetical protein